MANRSLEFPLIPAAAWPAAGMSVPAFKIRLITSKGWNRLQPTVRFTITPLKESKRPRIQTRGVDSGTAWDIASMAWSRPIGDMPDFFYVLFPERDEADADGWPMHKLDLQIVANFIARGSKAYTQNEVDLAISAFGEGWRDVILKRDYRERLLVAQDALLEKGVDVRVRSQGKIGRLGKRRASRVAHELQAQRIVEDARIFLVRQRQRLPLSDEQIRDSARSRAWIESRVQQFKFDFAELRREATFAMRENGDDEDVQATVEAMIDSLEQRFDRG